MKKLLTICILALITVGCSGTSSKPKSKDKFPISCGRENPSGEGHSTYGIPVLWSC